MCTREAAKAGEPAAGMGVGPAAGSGAVLAVGCIVEKGGVSFHGSTANQTNKLDSLADGSNMPKTLVRLRDSNLHQVLDILKPLTLAEVLEVGWEVGSEVVEVVGCR